MEIRSQAGRYLIEAVEAFRLGMDAQGNDALVKFIDLISPWLDQQKEKLKPQDAQLVKDIFLAQSRGDYLFVADLLEYVLPKSALGVCL